MLKLCKKCNIEKPIEDFYFHHKGRLSSECKLCKQAYQKDWHTKQDPKETAKRSLLYYHAHEEHLRVLTNLARKRKKVEVLTHYGNGKLACVRCEMDDVRALSIDHIAGGGGIHRCEVGRGKEMYGWLARNNFPEGYQTLCMNCQWIKRAEEREDNNRDE